MPVVDMNSGQTLHGHASEEFKAADESPAGLETCLDDLTGFAQKLGDNMANVASQSAGMGDEITQAFVPKPDEAGVAAISGAGQTLNAQSAPDDGASDGGQESVFRTEDDAAQSNIGAPKAINSGGMAASPVQIPAEGRSTSLTANGSATRRSDGSGSVEHSAPPVQVTANITVNAPTGSDLRDTARQIVDELARLKIRGHG